jgi:hypothetical protein
VSAIAARFGSQGRTIAPLLKRLQRSNCSPPTWTYWKSCRKAKWITSPPRSPIVRFSKKESLTLGENLRSILLLVSGRVSVYEPTFRRQDLTFSVLEDGTGLGQTGSRPGPSQALRHSEDPRGAPTIHTRRTDDPSGPSQAAPVG